MLWEYRSLEEIENMTWKKNDVKSFDAKISEDGVYDVFILFRHASGFPYSKLSLNMTAKGEGLDHSSVVEIPVIDEGTKKYLGDGSGDLWDIEHVALSNQKLTSGNYHIELNQAMNFDELLLAMEVGIMVKKSKE